MGNYVFDADALEEAVVRDHEREGTKHDMGGDIVPDFVDGARPRSTTSPNNEVPGSTDRDRGYWRDVGTIDSYYDAHMDLISIHPVFNLYNYDWPIYTSHSPYPPAKFVHGSGDRIGEALNSAVSPGVVVSGAIVYARCSHRSSVHSYASLQGSVLLDNAGSRSAPEPRCAAPSSTRTSSCRGRRSASTTSTTGHAGFHVTETGIVVVAQGPGGH